VCELYVNDVFPAPIWVRVVGAEPVALTVQ
jgi:hypothetical protein